MVELSPEEANFVVIRDILKNDVPKYLRIYFLEQWNDKHPNQKWQSNNSSGQDLVSNLSNASKSTVSSEVIRALETGNENEWDIDTLLFALQYSDLNVMKVCRQKGQRATKLSSIPEKEIDLLMGMEKRFSSAHARNLSCPSEEFKDLVGIVKKFASHVLSEDAQTEICEKVKEQLKRNAGKFQCIKIVKYGI